MTVIIDGQPLAVDEVVAVASRLAEVEIGPELRARMQPARDLVDRAVSEDRVLYGVTTGFGALASHRISPDEAEALQIRLIRSHAAGVGGPLSDEVVRAMLVLRARTLAQGHSGVRPALAERYIEFLRYDLLPVVPSKGSVGASGDLAPFAHLALPVIGEGFLKDNGVVEPASVVLARHGLEPIELKAKEGLSLLNGTEGMLAQGVLGLHRARVLAETADVAAALSVEALMGSARPFRPEVHALRPHPGQIESATRIRGLLDGSGIGASHVDDFAHAVQDAYSLRCAPQVHGAVHDTIAHAGSVFERELGAVVDNPIVFPDIDEVISAGNFHGQPLAFVLDFLTIAVTELGNISERRTDRMLDPERSAGLPAFLAARPGVNSGYMLLQYTAAALVAESRVLSHPASIESIPTSGSQEDHVSMGWGAALKLTQVLDNITNVLAVEILCAVQGIEYRQPLQPAPSTAAIVAAVRQNVPPLMDDRVLAPEIEIVAQMIRDGVLRREVRL